MSEQSENEATASYFRVLANKAEARILNGELHGTALNMVLEVMKVATVTSPTETSSTAPAPPKGAMKQTTPAVHPGPTFRERLFSGEALLEALLTPVKREDFRTKNPYSALTFYARHEHDFSFYGQVIAFGDKKQVRRLRQLGNKGMEQLEEVLHRLGLSIGMVPVDCKPLLERAFALRKEGTGLQEIATKLRSEFGDDHRPQ